MIHVRYANSTSKEKTTYEKELFWTHIDNPPSWKDIKHLELEDDDTIFATTSTDENGSDDGYIVSVVRWVEETDEEWQERLSDMKESEDRAKERRLQSYLKLKAEFEPDTIK